MNNADRPEQLLVAAQLEKNLAQKAYKAGDRVMAWKHLRQVLIRLSVPVMDHECQGLFVSTSLEFSNLCFVLGQGFNEAVTYLQMAITVAGRLGDQRSRAMINLHIGRLYHFSERRQAAMDSFKAGKAEVDRLGDDQILDQSAEFIGLYYFIQGLFIEALPHFERATKSFEDQDRGQVLNPSGPLWLSYCAAFLGQYHRAIGTLDYYRRLALEKSDYTLATTLRSALGILLLGIKKNREAFFHLTTALQEATSTNNAFAQYFARGGLGYYYFLEGRLKESLGWTEQAVAHGAGAGLVRQYDSPFVLEILFEYHQRGMEPIPNISFHTELHRFMQEPSIHLRGVALRLRAMEAAANGEDNSIIESDLAKSESYLERTGDPNQLAKTRLEIARLRLREGNQEEACLLAKKAWKGFSGYEDVFYPDDLRNLLAVKSNLLPKWDAREEFIERFVEVIQEVVPSTDIDALLARTIAATNRFFGAERGGIFWFSHRKTKPSPRLRAACNLTSTDVTSVSFNSNLALVMKTYRENRPQVVRLGDADFMSNQVKAMLCVPFELEGQPRGVLYHDNSYVNDCFDYFNRSQLQRIANFLTIYIAQLYEFSRSLEKQATLRYPQLDQPMRPKIMTQSRKMLKLLGQADRIAATESTVLILGETGVGKELLAHRLHQMSPRCDRPLIIIDPSTISQNLVESELFGHEKGSFTGADHKKIGLLEKAHSGTLFIDEVGEMPKSIQVKFLRALQEKAFIRVGGTRTLNSNFRLIAATNRDLADEVAAGHFREDLYYRLNVVPLTILSLRERKEDILLLASYYLDRYASKYGNPSVRITSEDKNKLMAYNWPGNVRELKNVIERAVLLSTTDQLELNLPLGEKTFSYNLFTDHPTLDEIQRCYIRHTLDMTGGKIGGPGGAAEILGMKRTTLNNRMTKLGLR